MFRSAGDALCPLVGTVEGDDHLVGRLFYMQHQCERRTHYLELARPRSDEFTGCLFLCRTGHGDAAQQRGDNDKFSHISACIDCVSNRQSYSISL